MADANIRAVITARDEASSVVKGFSDNIDGAMGKIATALKYATVAAAALAATGFAAAAKASWDQVDAVQQATVALKAYESDGTKVNSVLKDLIAYARSDLGVLFNRRDLFQSAQSLKLMGDNTADLVNHVKILSRSVGLGLSTWQELDLIVGRVGSTGRLTGDDFDNLTKAGYRLDPALRNTNISFTELFKALDKGIPVNALDGQANTIKGLSIRMQTAFRGIGDAILGVDSETSKFVEGGLGDRLTKAIGNATDLMKNFKQPIADATNTMIDFTLRGIDFLHRTIIETKKDFDIFISALSGAATNVSGSEQFTKIVLVLSKIHNAYRVFIEDVKALASGFVNSTPVIILTQYFQQVLWPILKEIGNTIKTQVRPAFIEFYDSISRLVNAMNPALTDALKIIGGIILGVLMGIVLGFILTLKALVDGFIFVANAISLVIGWISNLIAWFGNLLMTGWNIIRGLIAIFSNLVPAIRDVIGVVVSIFQGLGGLILGAIGSFGKLLYNTGRDLIQGLINGVKDMGGAIGDAVKGVAEGAVNKAKSILHIKSPSKVFEEIGQNVSLGFAQGIESGNQGSVPDAVSSLGNSAINSTPAVNTSSQSGPINITVQAGAFMGNPQDARQYAKLILSSLQDVASSRGMSFDDLWQHNGVRSI